MFHLRITPARTTSQLRSAANPNELEDEGYTIEGEHVVVETQAEADELMSRYSNLDLELAASEEAESGPSADSGDDTGDGSDNDETPTCAGMDGECSREVDEPGDYCWQHEE